MPVKRVTAIVLMGLLASACMSFSTLGRARVVEVGRVQIYGAPEALVVATDSGASIRPIAEVGVRVGVTPELELGARVTTLGLTLGARTQLHRSPDPRSGVDVLLAPALAYTVQDKLALEAPVLIGINLGDHQLVVAPRVTYQMRLAVPGQAAPASYLYLGVSVGLVIRLDDHVALMPEIAALGQVYADPGYASSLSSALGLQGSIGLLVDP